MEDTPIVTFEIISPAGEVVDTQQALRSMRPSMPPGFTCRIVEPAPASPEPAPEPAPKRTKTPAGE